MSSVQPAPALLAKSAATVVAAKGTTAGPAVLAVADATAQMMAWLRLKQPMIAGAAAVYAGGLSMRELSLPDTLCLCVGLLLCLVLPLMMSARPPKRPAARISCLKIVWAGQAALAVAGLVLILSQPAAVYATVAGTLAWI